MPANEFIANGLAHPAKAYRKLLETVKSSGARLRVVRGGETFDWGGGASATVVQGAGARGVSPDDYNNNSLVIRMTFGKTSFLFTGDCEDEEEEAIQELEKAVALAPGNAFAHFQLGLLYPPRDLEKARRAIARCLELEPEGRHAAEARLLAAELEADR